MKILPVSDPAFSKYGKVISGYDFSPLLETLDSTTEKPLDSVIYVPSDANLEAAKVYENLRDNLYGGMPIQVGYCNGSNNTLNCLEYHRGSEINIASDDIVLLLAPLCEVKDGTLDTGLVEAFVLPKGDAVLLYETTLHFAPCNGNNEDSFRVIVVLPKDTNTEKPEISNVTLEDKMLFAKNKWLIAHADSPEAKSGAHVGLIGDNIKI